MYQLFDFSTRVFCALVLCLSILACKSELPESSNTNETVYFCGAENRIERSGATFFDDGQGEFYGGGHQTDDFSFQGKYCIRVDSIEPYGMPITFTDVLEGEYFEARVWIKNPVGRGTLIAGVCGHSNYSLNTTDVNKIQDSIGWSEYFLSFGIETPIDTLKFYLFSAGEVTYFDNLEIHRFKERPPLNADSIDIMRIFIPDSGMALLTEFKTKALEQDIISSDLKEYVEGFIIEKNDSIPIEIRLKGDWTDHLENGKTSYRIKTEKAYRNLTTFSIQHPGTRNYMHEWFMHKLCDIEGLLSTSYDFLPVEINGVNQGVYAIEEHFDKQLLESRNRREGPILKMDESGFWALLASGKKEEVNGSYPYFESAMITCFKAGRTEKTPGLFEQFKNASSLLYLFKNLYNKPEQLFDLEKAAKYYALMDLANVSHSLAWHNRRYYANPVTTKLENIGFDMIPAILPMNPIIAKRKFEIASAATEDETAIDFYLFSNKKFREYYTFYSHKYNSDNYLDSAFSELESEINEREKILNYEFPNYHLDRQFYYDKAAFNRNDLANLDSCWDQFFEKVKSIPNPKIITPNYPELKQPFFLKEISVNAYREQIDSNLYKIQVENFHLADVKLVGYSTKSGDDSIFLFDKSIDLESYDGIKKPSYAEIILPKKANKIHFTVANIPGAIQSKNIFDWPKPTGLHPRIELGKKFRSINKLYNISDDTLIIKKGNHLVTELIYVPEDYHIIIEAGAEIDITNRGGLIFNNTVSMNGTEQEKIKIYSSDSTSQGITILNGKEVSIRYTEIDNQGNLDYEGWVLTGALTIYEANVSISHLTIKNNFCEDALNIIRGSFEIDSLIISDTYGDGFDADFCTGKLTKSLFKNTGNDCIDFSGSEVAISYLTIRNAGDKGVSSGERSNLTLSNIDIDGALTALASKDGSTLTGDVIRAINCEVGVALFKKKPEYEYSKMILTNCTFDKIKILGLIERGARLSFAGYHFFGNLVFDIDAMYARWQK